MNDFQSAFIANKLGNVQDDQTKQATGFDGGLLLKPEPEPAPMPEAPEPEAPVQSVAPNIDPSTIESATSENTPFLKIDLTPKEYDLNEGGFAPTGNEKADRLTRNALLFVAKNGQNAQDLLEGLAMSGQNAEITMKIAARIQKGLPPDQWGSPTPFHTSAAYKLLDNVRKVAEGTLNAKNAKTKAEKDALELFRVQKTNQANIEGDLARSSREQADAKQSNLSLKELSKINQAKGEISDILNLPEEDRKAALSKFPNLAALSPSTLESMRLEIDTSKSDQLGSILKNYTAQGRKVLADTVNWAGILGGVDNSAKAFDMIMEKENEVTNGKGRNYKDAGKTLAADLTNKLGFGQEFVNLAFQDDPVYDVNLMKKAAIGQMTGPAMTKLYGTSQSSKEMQGATAWFPQATDTKEVLAWKIPMFKAAVQAVVDGRKNAGKDLSEATAPTPEELNIFGNFGAQAAAKLAKQHAPTQPGAVPSGKYKVIVRPVGQ